MRMMNERVTPMARLVSIVLAYAVGIGVGGCDGSFTLELLTTDGDGCFQQGVVETQCHTEEVFEEQCYEQDVVETQCHSEEILEEQCLVIGFVEICETVVVDVIEVCEDVVVDTLLVCEDVVIDVIEVCEDVVIDSVLVCE